MAEGLLRKRAGDRFDVLSAGLDPRPIPAETVRVMDEVGVDIRAQRPKSVLDFLGREYFGYVITVCPNAESKCPVFPGAARRLYWPFDDPANAAGEPEQRLATFRQVRDRIDARIVAWLEEPRSADGGLAGGPPRPPVAPARKPFENGMPEEIPAG
jgi:arsenate reductase